MEMTLHTLEYLLSFSVPLCPVEPRRENRRLKGIKLWNEYEHSWDVLYLVTSEQLYAARQNSRNRTDDRLETCCFACPEPVLGKNMLCPQNPMDETDFFNRIQDCFFPMKPGWRKSMICFFIP